ncbi:MAG: hypothetical protein IJJ66_09010, partial [Treponema sp.]|nr:hypothetical protein [Treponema sp.]
YNAKDFYKAMLIFLHPTSSVPALPQTHPAYAHQCQFAGISFREQKKLANQTLFLTGWQATASYFQIPK